MWDWLWALGAVVAVLWVGFAVVCVGVVWLTDWDYGVTGWDAGDSDDQGDR